MLFKLHIMQAEREKQVTLYHAVKLKLLSERRKRNNSSARDIDNKSNSRQQPLSEWGEERESNIVSIFNFTLQWADITEESKRGTALDYLTSKLGQETNNLIYFFQNYS